MAINFFGLEIDRKTDILAFAAFLIAVASVLYQIIGFFQGAKIDIIPGDVITINTSIYGKTKYVRVISPMMYVNSGQPGYNAAVAKEYVEFKLVEKYRQDWIYFVNYSKKGEEESIDLGDIKSIHPFTVNAGSAASHETYFAPFPLDCDGDPDCNPSANYLPLEDFLKYLSMAVIDKDKIELEFTFTALVLPSKRLMSTCNAQIFKNYLELLERRGWFSAICKRGSKDTRREIPW